MQADRLSCCRQPSLPGRRAALANPEAETAAVNALPRPGRERNCAGTATDRAGRHRERARAAPLAQLPPDAADAFIGGLLRHSGIVGDRRPVQRLAAARKPVPRARLPRLRPTGWQLAPAVPVWAACCPAAAFTVAAQRAAKRNLSRSGGSRKISPPASQRNSRNQGKPLWQLLVERDAAGPKSRPRRRI